MRKGFGEQLRAAREFQRLRQADVARLSGLSSAYLSHLERSDRLPNTSSCIALCKALHLTMIVDCEGVQLLQNV